MSRQISSCFISAPAGANLAVLRASLERRGILVTVPEDFDSSASLVSEIRERIAGTDLVIGILTKDRRSQWSLFELGVASALNKQILLITPPNSEPPPISLGRLLAVRTSLSNREAIDFALDQILAAPPTTMRPTVRAAKSVKHTQFGQQVNLAINRYSVALANNDGLEFERIIASIIRNSGIDLLVEAPTVDKGFDIAVWADELGSFVDNPLLIEIKLRISDFNAFERVARQLSSNISAAGARWGLLIYGEAPRTGRGLIAASPTILAISFSDLANEMRTRSFAEVVRDLRNARMHGEPSKWHL